MHFSLEGYAEKKTMTTPTNIQITRIQNDRFEFDDKWVTPRSREREMQREKRMTVVPPAPKKMPIDPLTDEEAKAWAAELDELCLSPSSNIDRGGWRMLQEYKMSEEYNRWHTLDDHLDYGALLRGIHKIQEKGGDGAAEERFMNGVCDRFGHERLW